MSDRGRDARGPATQNNSAKVGNLQPPGRSCDVGKNLDGEFRQPEARTVVTNAAESLLAEQRILASGCLNLH